MNVQLVLSYSIKRLDLESKFNIAMNKYFIFELNLCEKGAFTYSKMMKKAVTSYVNAPKAKNGKKGSIPYGKINVSMSTIICMSGFVLLPQNIFSRSIECATVPGTIFEKC